MEKSMTTLAPSDKIRYHTSMSLPTMPDRRRFLTLSAAALGATVLPDFPQVRAAETASPYPFCTFTKALQAMSYADMAKALAAMEFDGVESAVRPGGSVEPERVADDLPRLVEALAVEKLTLMIATSGINEVSDAQHTETVLRTAAKLGVPRFRMNYYRYDLGKPIRPQLDEFRAKLKDLIALTDEIGIKPIYQNHSGKDYFGAPLWDLGEVLEDYRPEQIGVAFDIGHATVEGAKCWPLHFAMIRPYLDTVYVKEPTWQNNKLDWGPLGAGAVDTGFYPTLKKSGFTGPISLHVEYLGHDQADIVPAVLEAIRKDFQTLRGLLA